MPRLTDEELAALRAAEAKMAAEFEDKQQAELDLYKIPEEFRSAIRTLAWDQGHAYGYHEVLGYVSELCGYLAPAIEAYKKRINEGQSAGGGGG